MSSSGKRGISSIWVVLLSVSLGIGILFAFGILNMEMRWYVMVLVLIGGGAGLYLIKDRKLHLLRLMASCIAFEVGFLYADVLGTDLFVITDAFLMILVAIWFYESNGFRKGGIYWGKVALPALAMIIWSTLSLLPAESQLATGFGIVMLIKCFGLYLYLVNQINNRKELKIVVNWLLIGLLFQGMLGTYQKLSGGTLGLYFLGERDYYYFKSATSRVVGTIGFPNQFGAYLILLLPLAVSLSAFSKKWIQRLGYASISGISLVALFFSLSRSSWIGIVMAILVMLLILAKRRKLSPRLIKPIIVVMIGMVVLAAVFWDVIIERMETGEKGEYRTLMIQIAIPMALSHPIFGVGLNNYQWHSYHLFKFWHPVHNEYLRLACETGFPGLFFFLWFLVVILKEANRITKLKDAYLSAVGLGIIGGYVAFLVAVLFGPQYQHYRLQFLFWFLAGITFCIRRMVKLEWLGQQKAAQIKQGFGVKLREVPTAFFSMR